MDSLKFAEKLYDTMRLIRLADSQHRIRRVKLKADGLCIKFDNHYRAVIALSDLQMPASRPIVALIDFTPLSVKLHTDDGDKVEVGADLLFELAQPGGRAAFEKEMRSKALVVDVAVQYLRQRLGMTVASLAEKSQLPVAKLVGIEAGAAVSHWDLFGIGAALDAHVPDIIELQLLLTIGAQLRIGHPSGPKAAS